MQNKEFQSNTAPVTTTKRKLKWEKMKLIDFCDEYYWLMDEYGYVTLRKINPTLSFHPHHHLLDLPDLIYP